MKIATVGTNIIFQKSSQKNRSIRQGPKSLKLLYSIMNLNTISLPWQASPTKISSLGVSTYTCQSLRLACAMTFYGKQISKVDILFPSTCNQGRKSWTNCYNLCKRKVETKYSGKLYLALIFSADTHMVGRLPPFSKR